MFNSINQLPIGEQIATQIKPTVTNFLCTIQFPHELIHAMNGLAFNDDSSTSCIRQYFWDDKFVDRFEHLENELCQRLTYPVYTNISNIFDLRKLLIDLMVEKRQLMTDFLIHEQISNFQKWNEAWKQCPLQEILFDFPLRKDDLGFGCEEFYRSRSLSSTYQAIKEKLSYRNVPSIFFHKVFTNLDVLFKGLVYNSIPHDVNQLQSVS